MKALGGQYPGQHFWKIFGSFMCANNYGRPAEKGLGQDRLIRREDIMQTIHK
jgi:hypothetical protein